RYQFPFTGNGDSQAVDTPDLLNSVLTAHGIAVRQIKDSSPLALREVDKSLHLERTLSAVVRGLEQMKADPRGLIWVELTTLLPPWDIPFEYLRRYFAEDRGEDPSLTPWTDPLSGPVDGEYDQAFARLQNT